MRLIYCTLLFISFAAMFSSCRRIKRKGLQAIDKVFPIYNSSTPDTENNKKRFKEHLKVNLTADVQNIYAYGDFLGADYKVLISFHCDTSTISRIVQQRGMVPEKDDTGLEFSDEFFWWDKKAIQNITPYREGKDGEYFTYLWFDKKTKTAYYEEFSL